MGNPVVLVTPHAARTYRERVATQCVDDRSAEGQIRAALTERLVFCLALGGGKGGVLWACVSPEGKPFLLLTDAPPDLRTARHLLVRTCGPWWFWREARRAWRAAGFVRRDGKSRDWVLVFPRAEARQERTFPDAPAAPFTLSPP